MKISDLLETFRQWKENNSIYGFCWIELFADGSCNIQNMDDVFVHDIYGEANFDAIEDLIDYLEKTE